MKKIYLYIALLSYIIVSNNLLSKNKESILTISTSTDYPPFVFMKNNEHVGFDIDIIKIIAERLHMKPEIIDMELQTIFPSLLSNKTQVAISCFMKTKERERNFDFSNEYFYTSKSIIYNIKNNNKIPNSIEAIDKEKIGITIGSSEESLFKELMSKNNENYNIILFNTQNQEIEALKNNSIDIIVMQKENAEIFIRKNKSLKYIEINDLRTSCRILLKKNSPLTSKVNEILYNLQEDGTIKELKEKWFGKEQ